jgi:hypothetical protein
MTTDPNMPSVPDAPVPAASDLSPTPAPGPGAKGTQSSAQPPAAPPTAGAERAEGELAIEGEGYPLTFPDGLPSTLVTEDATAMLSEFGVLAKSVGVSQTEANQFVRLYTEVATSEAHAVDAGNPDSVRGWLRERWGGEFDARLNKVHATVHKLGPKFSAWLNATGLGNDPAVLVALAEYGAGTSKLPKAEAQRQLDTIMGDPKHPYWHGSKSAVDRVRLLSEAAYAETSQEVERERVRKLEDSDSPTARLDRDIKVAEHDLAYLDGNHPDHRRAVERVTRLYRERYKE